MLSHNTKMYKLQWNLSHFLVTENIRENPFSQLFCWCLPSTTCTPGAAQLFSFPSTPGFQGCEAGHPRGQATGHREPHLPLSTSILEDVSSGGLFRPGNRDSIPVAFTTPSCPPLWKNNSVPKIKAPRTACPASNGVLENLLEKKQGSKLLLADFCLTSAWHPGALAPCECTKPCFLAHLINNQRSICLSFALQIYSLLFLINEWVVSEHGPNHSRHKFTL